MLSRGSIARGLEAETAKVKLLSSLLTVARRSALEDADALLLGLVLIRCSIARWFAGGVCIHRLFAPRLVAIDHPEAVAKFARRVGLRRLHTGNVQIVDDARSAL